MPLDRNELAQLVGAAPEPTPAASDTARAALRAENDAVRTSNAPEPLRTLSEWLSDPSALEPPKMILPFLVLDGRVTLLAAREKAGKSTLLGQAVATLSRGGDFLGQRCGPGKVIWYAIDEAAGDAVRRLNAYNADGDSVVIQTQRPTPEHLRTHIHEFQPALVVIDTLTELMFGRLQSDRDAMDMSRALGPFMDVLRDTNTAAVLVHHATKDGRDYRGSGQLGAKVDVIALLGIPGANSEQVDDDPDSDPEIETRRVLAVRGRGLNGRDRLHFDGSEYQLGEGEQGLTARIVRAVRDGASSVNKVAEVVKGRRQNVSTTITRLVEEGKLMRDGNTLRAPMFGTGSSGGSAHHAKDVAGTTSGTGASAPATKGETSREPLGTTREPPHALTGTSQPTPRTGVVPEFGVSIATNGNHHRTGPGAEPFDWSSLDGAA